MITGLIAVVIGIATIVSFNNGEVWSGVIGILLILLLLWLRVGFRNDSLAYNHRIDYWKMNGKERALARRQWEREAIEEEKKGRYVRSTSSNERNGREQAHEERMAELRAKQAAYDDRKRQEILQMHGLNGRLLVCNKCCRYVKSEDSKIWVSSDGTLMYKCPLCGAGNGIKLAI